MHPGPAGPAVLPDPDRHHARLAGAARPARSWSDGSAYRCIADNDANLGALAELHHGQRPRLGTTSIYVKVASGVGAGIVLGGRLHRGASGIAGEIGHVQVGEDGPVCRCGNRGCVETMVSAPG